MNKTSEIKFKFDLESNSRIQVDVYSLKIYIWINPKSNSTIYIISNPNKHPKKRPIGR